MADDWDTLDGTTHDFLGPSYETARFVLDDMIHTRTLYKLDQKIHIVDLDFDNVKDWPDEVWDDIGDHYAGYFACLAISILLFVGVIIGACITCCCRCCSCCCCRCGRGDRNTANISYDGGRGKNMSWMQVFCLLFFLLITGAMLMGVVIMFTSNEAIRDELKYKNVYNKLHETAAEAQNFVNNTLEVAQGSIAVIYKNAQNDIVHTLYAIPGAAMDVIETKTEARTLLDKQVDFLTTIGDSAEEVDNLATELRADVAVLDTELKGIVSNLTRVLPDCGADAECKKLLDSLSVSADYSGLQSLDSLSQGASDAKAAAQDGYAQLDKVKGDILASLDDEIRDVELSLTEGYVGVMEFFDEVREDANDMDLVGEVDELEEWRIEQEDEHDMDIEDSIDSFFIFIVVLSSFLLLVVVLYLVGLLVGVCGSSDGSCSKSKASPCIMCGAYMLFPLLLIVIVVSIILLFVGGLPHTEVCRYFPDPNHYMKSIDTIDDIVMDKTDIELHVVRAVVECRGNTTLYNALGFEEATSLNLNQTMDPDQYGIPDELEELKNVDLQLSSISLLSDETTLKRVENDLNQVDYPAFEDALSGDITTGELNSIADDLAAYTSIDPPAFDQILTDIRALGGIVSISLLPKQTQALQGVNTIKTTSEGLPIEDQIVAIQAAEDELNADSDALATTVLIDTAADLVQVAYKLFEDLYNDVRYNIGKCGPLHNIAYGGLSYVCVDVLYPIEALWFGMGWFIVFAIISLFTACQVAGLFEPADVMRQYYANTYSPDPVYVKSTYM